MWLCYRVLYVCILQGSSIKALCGLEIPLEHGFVQITLGETFYVTNALYCTLI